MGTYPDLSLPCAARVRWWACCFQWLGSRIFRSIGIPLLNSCQNAPNFPPGGFSSAPLCAIINDAGAFVLPVKSFWRCSLTSAFKHAPESAGIDSHRPIAVDQGQSSLPDDPRRRDFTPSDSFSLNFQTLNSVFLILDSRIWHSVPGLFPGAARFRGQSRLIKVDKGCLRGPSRRKIPRGFCCIGVFGRQSRSIKLDKGSFVHRVSAPLTSSVAHLLNRVLYNIFSWNML